MKNKIIKLGNFFKVEYILCKPDEIKKCYFYGLCINKKRNRYTLINKLKKERLVFKFLNNNPLIIKISQQTKRINKIKKIAWKKKI